MAKSKVLIADTSEATIKVLSAFLSAEFEVHRVFDGEEVIEKYYDIKPDIILLDLNLPNMNGLEILNYIRNVVNDQDIYIIVFVNEENNRLRIESLNAGANDLLAKPFSKDEVKARIQVAKRQVVLLQNLQRAYKRINKEVNLVSELQLKLLPKESFIFKHIGLQSYYRPSGQASGDYYDYIKINNSLLRFCVADVSGHGTRAAFIMAIVRTIFRLEESKNYTLPKVVDLLNKSLIDVLGDESDFVTLFVGEIDLERKVFSYINAGHCPAVVKIDSKIMHLKPDYPVLGFFPIDPETKFLHYKDKFSILLYTDGFYEWNIDEEEQFGLERFLQLVDEYLKKEDKIYLEEIILSLERVSEFSPMYRDDLTALFVYTKDS
ncbi:Serine phosphatase RsbU, regulator of sigma subunit [Desulfonauticus submarinus]|uniref:Serine phosphatase RsbU, regulator of sigma subunit n=1 Tax=Desulfonauticus submarinus TaxID=206665 RepID=A0A1G9ZPN4_9BACT|nr:SpoIIE family protein phosphatase [Desulfonauticus submarinus]SDN23288.1 Serine phosphatase RsbU, regulator of sigma subunit [Desulfonauticus submarinus]